MVDSAVADMQAYFGEDTRRINHALKVLEYALKLCETEPGDEVIVGLAAALHDIGIHEAERKYNSSAGNYQELEGPAIAADILSDYGLSQEELNHICKIIANHHCAKDIDTPEFRIIWDADWLVNIPDEFDVNDKERMRKLMKVFKTPKGKQLAEKAFL